MIHFTPAYDVYTKNGVQSSAHQLSADVKKSAAPPAKSTTDRVDIRPESVFKGKMIEFTKKTADELKNAAGTEKLERLKKQLADGTYKVPSEQVAEEIMRRINPDENN